MKKQSRPDNGYKITNQTIIIDGCKISLNFLSSENTEIGAAVRSLLLKNSSKTLENTVDCR